MGRAIVTGAAGGFGRCFAHRLAGMRYALTLVDRRGDLLLQFREELAGRYSVDIQCHVCDMTDPQSLDHLVATLAAEPDIEFLVNNAGFAHLKSFAEIKPEEHARMAALHVHAPMKLIQAVLPVMIKRRTGSIINVSSLGAWLPAGDAQYAATKAYLLVLSQALHGELSPHGIRVQALCPSFVDTGFHNTAEMQRLPRQSIPSRLWMQAEQVIDCSLRSLQQGRVVVIPGWRNRLLSFVLRSPFLQPLVNRVVGSRQSTKHQHSSALEG
jgi:uncharacterized protein